MERISWPFITVQYPIYISGLFEFFSNTRTKEVKLGCFSRVHKDDTEIILFS